MKNGDPNIIIPDEMYILLENIAKQNDLTLSDVICDALGQYLSRRASGDFDSSVLYAIENNLKKQGTYLTSCDPIMLRVVVKSPIRYVHRPELKYEVHFKEGQKGAIGWLNINLRSYDIDMIRAFFEFSEHWRALEGKYANTIKDVGSGAYTSEEQAFSRRIYKPYTTAEEAVPDMAMAISDYINVFDELLKQYFTKRRSISSIEQTYLIFLADGRLII